MSKSFRRWLFMAALPLAAIGCTESTNSKDVADARQKVNEEQKDVDEARHEAMKPSIDDSAAQDIQKQEKDVAEAKADLNETERKHAATQARDAYALEVQKALDAADVQIRALKTRAGSEEGAAKEATQQQIDDLQTRRDRLDDALGNVKSADLLSWSDHKAEVQTALDELKAKLGTQR